MHGLIIILLSLYPQSSSHARSWADTGLALFIGQEICSIQNTYPPTIWVVSKSHLKWIHGYQRGKRGTSATSIGPLSKSPIDVYYPIRHTCNPGCDVRYVQITLCIAGKKRILKSLQKTLGSYIIRTLSGAQVLEC